MTGLGAAWVTVNNFLRGLEGTKALQKNIPQNVIKNAKFVMNIHS